MALVRWEPFRELAAFRTRWAGGWGSSRAGSRRGTDSPRAGCRPWTPGRRRASSCSRSTSRAFRRTRSQSSSRTTCSPSAGSASAPSEHSGERFYRFERRYGTFARSVTLPPGVQEDSIRAEYKDGVLEIRDPQARGAEAEADQGRLRRRHRGHQHPQGQVGDAQRLEAGTTLVPASPFRTASALVIRASPPVCATKANAASTLGRMLPAGSSSTSAASRSGLSSAIGSPSPPSRRSPGRRPAPA